MTISITGHNLGKAFNRRAIFDGVSFSLHEQQSMLISGANGSGKSTLVKMISGVLTPSRGNISIRMNEKEVGETLHNIIGFVAPYLQVYEEFSPRENLQFALDVRGMSLHRSRIEPLLEQLQLHGRFDDPVRTFSSGMKQRVKYGFALVHQPHILILDEPMANLDAYGSELVRRIMDEQRRKGILVVATNDDTDLNVNDVRIDLGQRE